ncbi:protein FAM117A isoform X2 [Dasypus novemcinctus]|uniref:protein FAM117A isoform X2 n=1 Tax=Dasypus novemcinctus TaxID=9361 RepID=UPI00265EA410|nr:protein FAM117A [Dasypus novemcinctus]
MAGAAAGGRGGGVWGPGRGGAGGLRRGCSPPAPAGSPRAGLQPLRATVPFQLQQPHQRRDGGGRAASVPCSVAPEKSVCRPQPPQVRRTFSLDTILSSYLLGQWPRDTDGAFTCCTNDKATQTPLSWQEQEGEQASSCTHKRSASWGSTDHRREISKLKQQLQRTKLSRSGKEKERGSPLQGDHALRGAVKVSPPSFLSGSSVLRLSPCLHRSLEGLNQELEEVFVKEQGEEELLRILDVPDGHRAPAPPQSGSCDHSLLPLEFGNLTSSPSSPLASPQPSGRVSREEHRATTEELAFISNDKASSPGHPAFLEDDSPSPVLTFAASPRPNHSYVFKREPPEGCERVRVFEEAITRGKYGEGAKQETFTFALTLVFIQCVINAVFAKILIQFFDTARVDRTRSWLYAACSISYLGAMVSSNSALQFVNYPTQVLGKSCKPIPVMLLGVTLLKKKYPLAKYLCVLLIVAGVALFMYKPKKVVGMEEHTVGYGELLLLLSLTLDGLTGVSQDHMRAHYQTGSNHMMLNINLWSTLLLGAGILFTGELWEFLSFAERYPAIIYNILLFGLTSALGQSFIFMTVVYFGPLTCSIITTTRKFFTILASVILFANPISPMQWVGTVLVFLGLGLDAKFGKGAKKTSH